jgi:ribonuclease P protein component
MARRAQRAADGRRLSARETWRSLQSADFAVVLGAPVLAKTPHFVLHHLATSPASHTRAGRSPVVEEISTALAPFLNHSVDNTSASALWWLGLVVPKRHARRAVTRSLLKRQMRAQAERYCGRLPAGQWLIRLRAPFDARQYPSAASARLRAAARSELAKVFAGAAP